MGSQSRKRTDNNNRQQAMVSHSHTQATDNRRPPDMDNRMAITRFRSSLVTDNRHRRMGTPRMHSSLVTATHHE